MHKMHTAPHRVPPSTNMQSGKESVVVNIISADDLPAHDKHHHSDPFACVDIESGSRIKKPHKKDFHHCTHVVHKTLHPEWAELFSLAATDAEEFVRFYVFSHHFISRDAFLCWGEVQLKDVQAAGGYLHEHQIKLTTPKDEPAGTIIASITYGTPQQTPPPPTLHAQHHGDSQQEAIEKVRGRIDKTPPTGQFNEETIEAARNFGMDGHQLDRAFKYFNMADPEGSGKIGFSDWQDLLNKARKKHQFSPLSNKGMMMMAPESALRAEFDKADTNKDGFLEFPEFLATWRDFEVALVNSSWNPIKNDARRLKMVAQDYTNMKAQGQHMQCQVYWN